MKIYQSEFTLTPKFRLNRTSNSLPIQGVYLMSEEGSLAEYFPHQGLGDQSAEAFLKTFPNPALSYHSKILQTLRLPLRPVAEELFFNHQIWFPGDEIRSPVIKYKLLNERDFTFLQLFEHNLRVRLDANGLFTPETYKTFRDKFAELDVTGIEYLEDPLSSIFWDSVDLPRAQDFIQGSPFEKIIFKPNRSFFQQSEKQTIWSGNMGSSMGTLVAYEEFVSLANLNDYHGIYVPNLFEEDQRTIFTGDYVTGFRPVLSEIKILRNEVTNRNWKLLCTV